MGIESSAIIALNTEIHETVQIWQNSQIRENVKIGEGSVIGAGSVVNSIIPPFSVACGIPAKIVKNRK